MEVDEEATFRRAAWEHTRSSDPALREKYEYKHVGLRLKSIWGKELGFLLMSMKREKVMILYMSSKVEGMGSRSYHENRLS